MEDQYWVVLHELDELKHNLRKLVDEIRERKTVEMAYCTAQEIWNNRGDEIACKIEELLNREGEK